MFTTTIILTLGAIGQLQPAVAEKEAMTPFDRRTTWLRRHVQRELGAPFALHETDHFLVFYDRHRMWAQRRGQLLERTYDVYHRAMREAGWEVHPIGEKLVCVLFFDRRDFGAYAGRTDRIEGKWQNGYYSRSTNRIAFFNDLSGTASSQLSGRIGRNRAQLDRMRLRLQRTQRPTQPAEHANLQASVQSLQRQIEADTMRQSLIVQRANQTKTTHEAAHQLAFNSGLQRRDAAYPFWVTEGLATSFEALDLGKPFGPGHPNARRHRTLDHAARRGKLVPLARLLAAFEAPAHDDRLRELMYAQSWGLFRFLFQRKPAELHGYIQALTRRRWAPEQDDPLKHFESFFGPVQQVEALLIEDLLEGPAPKKQ